MPAATHEPIPADFEVQPLKPGDPAKDRCTCGHCGLSWDDAVPTRWTPTHGPRCPFEYFHIYPDPDATGPMSDEVRDLVSDRIEHMREILESGEPSDLRAISTKLAEVYKDIRAILRDAIDNVVP